MSDLKRLEKFRRREVHKSMVALRDMEKAFAAVRFYEREIAARKAGPGWARDRLRPSRYDD